MLDYKSTGKALTLFLLAYDIFMLFVIGIHGYYYGFNNISMVKIYPLAIPLILDAFIIYLYIYKKEWFI